MPLSLTLQGLDGVSAVLKRGVSSASGAPLGVVEEWLASSYRAGLVGAGNLLS